MTATQQPHPDVSHPTAGRPLFALAIIGAVAVAAYFFFDSRRNLPENVAQVQKENEELRRQLAEFRDRQAELHAEELMDLESKQLLQSRLMELSGAGKLAQQQVEVFAAKVAGWQRLAGGLETSDDGRRIAANSQTAAQFLAIKREERPRPERPAELEVRLAALLLPVDEALQAKNSVYTPAEGLEEQIRSISDEATSGAAVYHNHTARLSGILAAAPRALSAETPTLGVALTNLERGWAEEENRRVAEAVARVREEELKKRAEEKAEAERKIGEAKREADRLAAELELRRIEDAKEEAAKNESHRQAERELRLQKETLEAEFKRDLPQIRRYLAEFLAEGYTQPDQYGYPRPTSTKGPVSLSSLQSAGALNDSIGGLSKLNIIGYQLRRERPGGGFPTWHGDVIQAPSIPYVKTAQGFLIKYGDLMVAKGLLQP